MGQTYIWWLLWKINSIRYTASRLYNQSSLQNGYVAVFFVSSAPKSEKEMAILRSEHEDYGDLLVTSLEESYENLVLKVIREGNLCTIN